MFSKSSSKPTSTPSEPVKKKPALSTARIPKSPSMQAPSILSRDLVITGEISTDGDVQIEGRLEGNIKATTLTIGEQGAVNGNIKAGTVFVRGKVTGKIVAETIELADTANVLADIKQDHLTIANGAFFDGKCSHKTKPTGANIKPAVPKS
ncbi:MAG: polymer-forming cytoskeletal protein [Robiginitomaculum sp.]